MIAPFLLAASLLAAPQERFEPTWESLNTHACPQWFRDAKFGIFIHWGVYSVPSFCDTSTYSEWYRHWVDTNAHDGLERRFHAENYGADFPYEDFAPMFRAELYDPAEWASVFRRAGARYVVLTSKHHDGYALWPSAEASASRGHPWNAAEVGPKRDVLGELTEAVRAEGLKMGLYYSFMEWHNPVFDRDIPEYVETVMFPQVKDLISRYHPAVFWPDGEWNHPDTTWRSTELLSWIYNHAPNKDEIVVNDRWGRGLRAKSGDYYTTEYGRHGGADATSNVRPWEECRGIGHSFAWNRNEPYEIYLSRTECVRLLIDIVSQGGTLLLDVGPTADGRIPLIMQDRLLAMGRWLDANGEAIYASEKSPFRHAPWGAATARGSTLYLHVYDWPEDDRIVVARLESEAKGARMLAGRRPALPVARLETGGVEVDLSGEHPFEHASVIALELDGAPRVDDRIHPGADGTLVLHAATAETFGGGLRLEASQPGKRPDGLPPAALEPDTNLGYWSEPESGARWEAALAPGTVYDVVLVYGCAPGQEGSTGVLSVGGVETHIEIREATGAWHDYAELPLGTVSSAEGGTQIAVRATRVAAGAALNLRALILVPRR